jgi:photosystem II stability/assembly factor-like uncharacterized protein
MSHDRPRWPSSRLCLSVGLSAIVLAQTSLFAQWEVEKSGTRARLRGVSVADERVAWASGSNGTVLRTIDGGATWRRLHIPGSEARDFRDVHAFDHRTAFVLSIGPGEQSQIDKTTNGGATWIPSLRNHDPRGFFDAIAFWDRAHGIVQGDPVGGRFQIMTTKDDGKTWNPASEQEMPRALDGEGAFAASGTSLVVLGDRRAWFGTGGAKTARVFRSTDRGRNWTVTATPIDAGSPSSGIFSLAFRDPDHGVAVGGDYKRGEQGGRTIALTNDGGRTWTVPKGPSPASFRSAVAWVPGTSPPTFLAVGPAGADISTDDGQTWKPIGTIGFHAVAFSGPRAGWAVGEDGRIARYEGRSNSTVVH